MEDIYKCEVRIGTKEVVKLSSRTAVWCWGGEDERSREFSVDLPESSVDDVKVEIGSSEGTFEEDHSRILPEHFRNEEVAYVLFRCLRFSRDPFEDDSEQQNPQARTEI